MGAYTIHLPPVMDAGACAALQSALTEQLPLHDALHLDASKVGRIGTPGAQLLVSLGHSMAADDKPMRMTSPSETLVQAFEDLGLSLAIALFTEHGKDEA